MQGVYDAHLPQLTRILGEAIYANNNAIGLLPDLSVREVAVLAPLALIIFFVVGLYPGPLMTTMDHSVMTLVERMQVASTIAPLP